MSSKEPLREDEVTSSYVPVQQRLDRATLPRGTPLALDARVDWSPLGCTISLPVRAEHVTVEKWPVVVEEVVVRTTQVEDTAHVDETLRHEELRVDTEGDVRVTEQRAAPADVYWQR